MARRKDKSTCLQCGVEFNPVYQSTGKFCTHECSVLYRSGERHHAWKGDGLGYFAAHSWLREHHSDAKKVCEECGVSYSLQFAKKHDREYTRNIDDYRILCQDCHLKYDGQFNRAPWNKGNVTTYPRRCEQCDAMFEGAKKTSRFCSNKCSARSRPMASYDRPRDKKGSFTSPAPDGEK